MIINQWNETEEKLPIKFFSLPMYALTKFK